MTDIKIRLTETVKKGGCAAKLPAGQLRSILSQLKIKTAPELLVGTGTMDDAALWDLKDGRCLIQTLDFFTPIVDDPYEFGSIAAANALSDVYAMGGQPATAMTILAFPCAHIPIEVLEPLMAGALDKIHEAGAVLVGGHSIDDDTLKLGFSVSGFVQKDRAWTNAGAKAGQKLILTKGLGTGTITSALKNGKASSHVARAAIESMQLLNCVPGLLQKFHVYAATDITGFGLAGHLMQMMQASNASAKVKLSSVPAIDGALELLGMEILNRAHHTNMSYVRESVYFGGDVTQAMKWLAVDPQTSGGLLLVVDAVDAPRICESLIGRFPKTQIIGDVLEADPKFQILFS